MTIFAYSFVHSFASHAARLGLPLLVLLCAPAQAEIYKCVINGKTTYANEPCAKDAKPAQLKGNVTVVDSKYLREASKATDAAPAGKTVAGIKVPNPVAECKAKGGTIDKELRACMLP